MHGVKRLMRSLAIPFLLLFCMVSPGSAQEKDKIHPEKTMRAVRVNPTPPKIDGILDDETWQYAPVFTGFTQREPDEGEAASESTTVQIVYDDEALYVGVMAYDSEPDKIVARLARRDQWANSDRISVDLDPHHDHQTGFWFAINAAGTLDDGYIYNDDWDDDTWDGVWQARSAIHAQGWSAEFKIPYHVLRFSPKEEYTWGINIVRDIIRKKERDYWIMVPRDEDGWASRFGHLEGIQGIKPSTHLEVLPYSVARSTFEPKSATNPDGRAFFSNLGGDLRYGITSALSLNATFNPDFAQVEADPAVLNLSVFETFFEERRPFFIEGSATFQNDDYDLFYSRRIGKRPGYFSTPSGSREISRPEATTILEAAKLTGKTAGKTTFGLLEAVTAPEYATIEEIVRDPVTGLEQNQRREYLIEPLTHYFVGRIQQDVLAGNSRVGLLTTMVQRKDAESAYVGAIDWNLRFQDNTHQLTGTLGASRAGPVAARKSGYLVHVEYDKPSGWLNLEAMTSALSPGFEANDLGFIRRVNRIRTSFRVGVQKNRPWAIFRRNFFNVNKWNWWNYDRVNLENELNVSSWHEFKNYWWFGGGFTHRFQSRDDLDTRGGPLIVNPEGNDYFASIESDWRRAVSGWLWGDWGSDTGGSKWYSFGPGVTIRPSSRIEIRFRPNYSRNLDAAQWVRNVDEEEDGITDHYVYGELSSQVLSLTTRADVTFTRDLSLQLYLQPFVAVGEYENFKELARPSSYEFTPYAGLGFNPNFSRRSLRSNLVLRWEYRPGSTLFLVWSQSRSAFSNDPKFRPFRSLSSGFKDDGPNIFLIKLNYWLRV